MVAMMSGGDSGSVLLVALAAMLWGGDLLLRPQALAGGWSPAFVVLAEHVLLLLAFAPVLWRGRDSWRRLSGRQWAALLFVSWGGSALATWCYTKAFALAPSHALTVVLLQKIQPVSAVFFAGFILRERRAPLFWLWGLLALAGAFLLSGVGSAPIGLDVKAGQALLALAAAALWGGATVGGRLLTPTVSPAFLSGARFALAVPVLGLLALFGSAAAPAFLHGAHGAVLALLLIVLLPDLLGMALYYQGLQKTPASVATLAELCYPLTALMLGIFFQRATLSPGQGLGLGLLLLAVLGLSRRPSVALIGGATG